MIELLDDVPAGVIGFKATGTISESDYNDVLIPSLKAALDGGDARVLCIFDTGMGSMTPAAMWEDVKFGVSHWHGWSRIALVTDDAGLRGATKALAWLMPGEVRAYPSAERPHAEAWLAS